MFVFTNGLFNFSPKQAWSCDNTPVSPFTPLTPCEAHSCLPLSPHRRGAPPRRPAPAAWTPPCLRSTPRRPPTLLPVKGHRRPRADCHPLISPPHTTVQSTPSIRSSECIRGPSWRGRRLWRPVTRWGQFEMWPSVSKCYRKPRPLQVEHPQVLSGELDQIECPSIFREPLPTLCPCTGMSLALRVSSGIYCWK